MRHLSIRNKMVRTLFFAFSLLAFTALTIKHFTDTASLDEYIILPILTLGFFYISLTNKIEIWIDEERIIFKWISLKKQEIKLSRIKEIYLKKYKIIIHTPEKDIKLDIFNAGRKNKELIRNFFRENTKVPIINQY